ncbi:single-stranded DNA-binding protein [Kushneria indalinina]|uniref:Single-stranded DNA-binding protein n=1 Tax=Kushneria indalinina DSM 14324 TaxID=1122140 RepID=A0A3D9DRL7_9GAMM|nr:single-stranded DNA-binding protein [Kushneria indalinina]REC93342.1 single-strand DNA-binding protein [Kushneria indalinina DSM 14324]
MSTRFFGEGNIGSDPEVKMFPSNGNQPPRGVMRLNVRFDNPVPSDNGNVDKGGFWANVEIWHRDVEQWAQLYQKGMRVLVPGRMVFSEWQDSERNNRSEYKVQADRIGILPFRISQVIQESAQNSQQNQQSQQRGAPPKSAGPDGEWSNPVGSNTYQ